MPYYICAHVHCPTYIKQYACVPLLIIYIHTNLGEVFLGIYTNASTCSDTLRIPRSFGDAYWL